MNSYLFMRMDWKIDGRVLANWLAWVYTRGYWHDIISDLQHDLSRVLNPFNTLRPRKMDAIFQTTFSNTFSSMKMYEFLLKFHWSLFLVGPINNIPSLV